MRAPHGWIVATAALASLACVEAPPAVAQPRPARATPADDGRPLVPYELKDDADLARALRESYTKYEHRIPMRDGARLFTSVYVPKDQARAWPILLHRTPASAPVASAPLRRARAKTRRAPTRSSAIRASPCPTSRSRRPGSCRST